MAKKKFDRNKKSGANLRYINERRHQKSHIRRITKHLKRFYDDKVAIEALKNYKISIGIAP
jgi:hypothetical protein